MPSQGSLRPSVAASHAAADERTTADTDVAAEDAAVGGPATDASPEADGGRRRDRKGGDDARPDEDVAAGVSPRVRAWGASAIAVVPFLVSAIVVFAGVGGHYHSYADVALTELLVRDVGRYEVLIGPYSRDGWHHLGPALFYVLAVPYRLLGGVGEGMVVGALLINAASVVGMALIARRRGGTPLMLCVLLANMLLVRALGWEFLDLAWNPYITVLPYALLVMLTWVMACGERWALPVAVVVTTFVVQTHIGYVALALPLLGLGTLWLVAGTLQRARAERAAATGPQLAAAHARGDGVAPDSNGNGNGAAASAPAAGGAALDAAAGASARAGEGAGGTAPAGLDAASGGAGPDADGSGADGGAAERSAADAGPGRGVRGWMRTGWRGTDLGRLAGAALIAVVVGGIAWLPPAIQQATGDPGNAGLVLKWFREHSGESRSLTEGWRVVTAQYGIPPEWLTGLYKQNIIAEADYIAFPLLPVLLVPVLAAIVLGWKRLGADGRRLMAVWFVASAVGVVAVARTVGALYAYRLAWAWTLGALAAAYVLWVAWTLVAERWPRAERRVLLPLGVGAVLVATVAASVGAVQAGTPHQSDSALIEEIHEEVAAALPPGDGEVVINPTSFTTMGHGIALVLELERDGVNVSYPLGGAANSQHRSPTAGPKAAELVIASDEGIIDFRDRPNLELIAVAGPMSMEELEVNAAEKAIIDARLEASEFDDLDDPDAQVHADVARSRELVPAGSMIAVFRRT